MIVSTMLAMGLVSMPAEAAAPGPLHVTIEGSAVVAVSEVHPYVITCVGGPGAELGGNYSYNANLVFSGTGGVVTPASAVSASGVFIINVTAPHAPEDMLLLVNVSSYNSINGLEQVHKEFHIKVIAPLVFSAIVKNQGSTVLSSVPIAFYLDGVKVYNTTFALDAKATKTIRYNYTNANLAGGTHVVRLELDPNNQYVKFSSGGTVLEQTIYVGVSNYGNSDGLLILVFFMLVFVTYFIYKRPKRKRKK